MHRVADNVFFLYSICVKSTSTAMRKLKIILPIALLAIGGFSVFYITQTLEQENVAPEESEAATVNEFTDSHGNVIEESELRFLISGEVGGVETRIFGLKSNSSLLYIWEQGADGLDLLYEGNILNSSGNKVPVNQLRFVETADINGDGNDELIALQSGGSWGYVWDTFIMFADTYPSADGVIRNSENKNVPVDWLKYVVSGDFDSDGKDEVRGLQNNASWNYIWGYEGSKDPFHLENSGNLENVSGAKVPIQSFVFVEAMELDGYGDILVTMTSNWYYMWNDETKPKRHGGLCNARQSSCRDKKLVFTLEQGLSNGLMIGLGNEHRYNETFARIVDSLTTIDELYDVHVLINPMIRDKSQLDYALDILTANDIKFIFYQYSSDGNTVGSRSAVAHPNQPGRDLYNEMHDVSHGLTLSTQQLQNYKNKYGEYFAGIRIFEVFSHTHFLEKWCAVNTCAFDLVYPDRYFWEKSIAEEYVQFARKNGMFVMWSDPQWVHFEKSWFQLSDYSQELQSIVDQNPDVIYLNYANNDVHVTKRNSNYELIQWKSKLPNVGSGIRGVGVSNQSWLCNHRLLTSEVNCPWQYLALWTASAFQDGAEIVQFEPFWYLWNWPKGRKNHISQLISTTDLDWDATGMPTTDFVKIAETLGVDIQSQSDQQSSCFSVTQLDELQSHYGQQCATSKCYQYDLNSDGLIDLRDVSEFAVHYSQEGCFL